jgi:hypothetical protein
MERRAIMNQLMNVIGMLPETGRKHVIEDHIASLAGFHSLRRYYPVPQDDVDLQEQQQEAARENALFKTGAPIPIAGGDNHAVHTEIHLQGATEVAQAAIQGQGNLAEMAVYLQTIIQHVAGHLEELSQDNTRTDLVKLYSEQVKELSKVIQQITKEAARQQQQQAEAMAAQQEMAAVQSGQDPKEQIAMMRMERDEARRDTKTQNDLERKTAKTTQDMALKDAKAAQSMRS